MSNNKKKHANRSKKAKRAAGQLYAKSNAGHWTRRILNAFKENKFVQERIINGEFDKVLEAK